MAVGFFEKMFIFVVEFRMHCELEFAPAPAPKRTLADDRRSEVRENGNGKEKQTGWDPQGLRLPNSLCDVPAVYLNQ